MKWLNIELEKLRSPEFIGSDPTARATWLCVNAYCADQENSGIIIGGANWKDRQWQQCCGVTLQEIIEAKPLVDIQGDDVHVLFYPISQQQLVETNRANASRGGKASGEARRKRKQSAASSENKATVKREQSAASSENEAQRERNSNSNSKGNSKNKEVVVAPPLGPTAPATTSALDFFKNKNCHVRGDEDFFEEMYETFSDEFLNHCIGTAKRERDRIGKPPKPCRSDLTTIIWREKGKYSNSLRKSVTGDLNGSEGNGADND